ncbi:Rv3212 family protein [Corynebacterium pseudotuberculosis]|uniref:Uncharacterized protein n=1 Tax=Corynebacterium pseudotuberculosis (strain C231) TaxID=681645 RepID=D9QEV3_CORP2|nr:hypothetical protein [Corynebacterium pseudotuberculosis]ADK28331.1 hypothetical protein CPFRC_02695 [Corynebacterium pseudotuberculosis FRC41]ADL10026.1 hypothetical protein CPC231_02695 [Corynebacterium pseudotuberculosis C231]ADL20430.1 hypothetical protein CP1002_02695 [Corynebacterium pseudotuberculosis 1002]ADO25818.1 hypothetical protein CPI19_02695 [Corynebacterium pseudotuberculosis I19]AEK91869.1 Hypothetical protein CpPAT10_0538 [Corynebacterium pseudotuberculosis PAT10]
MTKSLRKTRKDLIAATIIAGISITGVSIVWATAPVNNVTYSPAAQPLVVSETPPVPVHSLTPQWETPADQLTTKPIIAAGLVMSYDGHSVNAIDPATGAPVWSYARTEKLCSLGQAWSSVVLTFHTGRGCGDVVSLDAASGTYKATRSASASDVVVPISSNDAVGTVSSERVELWRSDLVRTVEYGDVPIKQEANQQPHEDCEISSALSRKTLLGVTEKCEEAWWLRLQKTVPEDSRVPEITRDIHISGENARIVAIGQEAAAVFVESPHPRIDSFNANGELTASIQVPLADASAWDHGPSVADLPHHITWFDGHRLYLFNPSSLHVEHIIDNVLGTGVAINNKLYVPVFNGIAVINWETGVAESVLEVDRGTYNGLVSLGLAGNHVVEKRGDHLVGLALS